MTDVPRLSIVVPCFNEEAGLETLVRAVDETGIAGVEFVFVNDGSTDGTLAVLRRLAESDGRSRSRGSLGRRPRCWRGCGGRVGPSW